MIHFISYVQQKELLNSRMQKEHFIVCKKNISTIYEVSDKKYT